MTTNSLFHFFSKLSSKQVLFGMIFLQILLHLPILNLPPMGQHTWRQVMGLTTAMNYFQNGDSFFYPTQNVVEGIKDSGFAYFEFPLVYWLIGQAYSIFGFSHFWGRAFALFFGVLYLIAGLKFIQVFEFSENFNKWYLFFLGTSPFYFYYSISLLPNLQGLTLFLFSFGLLNYALKNPRMNFSFWSGVFLLSLAVLMKASYLFYGTVVFSLFLYYFYTSKNYKILWMGILGSIIVLLPSILVYFHAKELATISETRRFWIELSPLRFPSDIKIWAQIFYKMLGTWMIGYIVSYAAAFFFFAGIFYFFKEQIFQKLSGFKKLIGFSWGVSFSILFSMFALRFIEHAYYQTSIIIIPPLFCAIGAQRFFHTSRSYLIKTISGILILLVTVLMVSRVYKRWTVNRQVPEELLYHSAKFQELIPKKNLVLAVGDSSPLIYLYFLNRRGLAISKNVDQKELKKYQANGFSYLVTDEKLEQIDLTKNCKSTNEIGSFTICRL